MLHCFLNLLLLVTKSFLFGFCCIIITPKEGTKMKVALFNSTYHDLAKISE